jgi:hypothetical protein
LEKHIFSNLNFLIFYFFDEVICFESNIILFDKFQITLLDLLKILALGAREVIKVSEQTVPLAKN